MADPAVAIVLNRTALQARYGDTAYDQISHLLLEYQQTIDAKGLPSDLLVVDDAANMARYHLAPARSADEIAARIRAANHVYGNNLAYVLLIGGDECLPFFRLHNQVLGRIDTDPDQEVLSDNP